MIKDTGKYPKKGRKGMVLILTFIIITTLTAIVVAFLYMSSTQLKGSGYDAASHQALWLAEAGIQKAIWYLKTSVASGGKGDAWDTTVTGSITENLGNGSYTLEVIPYDFALASNGATASDSPVTNQANCDNANDGDDDTYWESGGVPSVTAQSLIIQFPYTLSINNASFVVPTGGNGPRAYTLAVSTNGSSWTTVATTNTTNKFLVKSNVNWLRLRITAGVTAGQTVKIASINTKGNKITSTGTLGVITRQIQQTVVVKETTQTGYGAAEKDWNETD